MKRNTGFYIAVIAAVVGIVSIIMYGSSLNKSQNTYIFLIAAAVVACAAALLSKKSPGICNWGGAAAAALAAVGIGYSITVMADAIGYVISGLYSFDTLQGWIRFMIAAGISWLLYIIAGFTGMAREDAA